MLALQHCVMTSCTYCNASYDDGYTKRSSDANYCSICLRCVTYNGPVCSNKHTSKICILSMKHATGISRCIYCDANVCLDCVERNEGAPVYTCNKCRKVWNLKVNTPL